MEAAADEWAVEDAADRALRERALSTRLSSSQRSCSEPTGDTGTAYDERRPTMLEWTELVMADEWLEHALLEQSEERTLESGMSMLSCEGRSSRSKG